MTRSITWIKSLFRLEPMQHAWWEHLIFRAFLAYLLLSTVPFMWPGTSGVPQYDSLPYPSGLGELSSRITMLSDVSVFTTVRIVFWIAICLYVIGVVVPLALTCIFLTDMALGGLYGSQGAHGHSQQALALCVLGLTLASWVGVFLRTHGGRKNLLLWTIGAQNLAMNWGRQMIVAAYAVSAVTKEINSEGLWFAHSKPFVLSAIKAQQEAVIKGVEITDAAKDAVLWLGNHSILACLMLLSAWLLEMCAPLMLLNRRIALLIGLMLWVFHWMNGWLMGLPFPLNRALIMLLFINLPFWLFWFWNKSRGYKIETS